MQHLTHQAIDIQALLTGVEHADGAAILFTGTVREQNLGRPVNGMAYTAQEAMAEACLATICDEAKAQFEITRCQIIHRLGRLALGEVSVAICVSSPHRAAAYDASRYAIEELKKRAPIWKQEFYIDGENQYLDGQTPPAAL